MRVAVIRFPGSNCDLDVVTSLGEIPGFKPSLVWHESADLGGYDAVVVPGGFTFGDYLRAGAIAARSPAIARVKRMAERGTPVLGICNGFQILVEAGLLPGSLLRNSSLKFVCKWVAVRVDNNRTPFTRGMDVGTVLRMPVAHGEGMFFDSKDEVNRLIKEKRAVFRYVDDRGRTTADSNPNGSLENIAGLCNEEGNVVALMPHPERACDRLLSPFGSEDGRLVFLSLLRGGEADD